MQLTTLDWGIILAFFVITLAIGIVTSRKAGKSFQEFFLSGRGMPWWLLGVSMVATTFSADTPNLVTDIVRQQGVSGNWQWWCFLLTGMLTVFVYAKLWRRSGILTDLEFYEIRYSGKAAAWLRGFRAFYLGVVFNVFIMATVSLAAIKIGKVLLGLDPVETVIIASTITVIYTSMGGLRGVILTDFFQFALAMTGMIWAAVEIVNLPEIGGLTNLLTHENVRDKISFLPDFTDPSVYIPLFLIPLAVQWWSVWYPGAEPGGGGYVVQRMLAAKDERNAAGATLFFNIAHYALRPWPWLLIALASLIVFPTLDSLRAVYPDLNETYIGHDLAFSAMLTYLSPGLLGLIAAGLIAAYMSTISTHLNWGASYLINDLYKRFIKPEATDSEMVLWGRLATVVLMIISAVFALYLRNALGAFQIILQIGAGTGLIFILRWFWMRINAFTEIAGMVVSFIVAIVLQRYYPDMPGHIQLLWGVGITTIAWLTVTFLTRPTDSAVIQSFRERVFLIRGDAGNTLGLEIASMIAGCFLVYGLLFTTGYLLYGMYVQALIGLAMATAAGWVIARNWPKLRFK